MVIGSFARIVDIDLKIKVTSVEESVILDGIQLETQNMAFK